MIETLDPGRDAFARRGRRTIGAGQLRAEPAFDADAIDFPLARVTHRSAGAADRSPDERRKRRERRGSAGPLNRRFFIGHGG